MDFLRKHERVCELHFLKSDFLHERSLKRSVEVVPSLNLPSNEDCDLSVVVDGIGMISNTMKWAKSPLEFGKMVQIFFDTTDFETSIREEITESNGTELVGELNPMTDEITTTG